MEVSVAFTHKFFCVGRVSLKYFLRIADRVFRPLLFAVQMWTLRQNIPVPELIGRVDSISEVINNVNCNRLTL